MSQFIPPSRLAYYYAGSGIVDAKVEGNTLTLTKRDEEGVETEIEFEGSSTQKIVKVSAAEFSTLSRNAITVLEDSPAAMALSFTLESPSETEKSEYRLVFRAGANTSAAITPPDGYAFSWITSEPEWKAGRVYEISFLSLEKALTDATTGKRLISVSCTDHS